MDYGSRWIIEHRGAKNVLDAQVPYAFLWEEERDANGEPAPTVTIFLTNRECPFRCLMCDLWQNTLDTRVPTGAIVNQIRHALDRLPPARQIKLYNAGSFFDPKAIPPEEDEAIAALIAGFERVIVEAHPAFIGERCRQFRRRLAGKLEVAIGLETAHPQVLRRLNKRFTVEDFQRKSAWLHQEEIDLRAFLLVRPPFMSEAEGLEWAKYSLDVAFDAGASVCCLIPTRGGNGAMEALAAAGMFSPPTLRSLEAAQEYGIGLRRGRVFADVWDIEKFYTCACSPARAQRIAAMNRSQTVPPKIDCDCLEPGFSGLADYQDVPVVQSPVNIENLTPRNPVNPLILKIRVQDKQPDTMQTEYDLAIIGSGFGGTLLAMIARRIGLRVVLVEKGSHPRFAIGESTSPLMNLLIEQLAHRYDLPRLLPLTTYGAWQAAYPDVVCGLKRGFTYYHHQAGRPFCPAPNWDNQLLVAASPSDAVADTHWLRADVDNFLLREALALGVEYLDETRLRGVEFQSEGAILTGERCGQAVRIGARFVVDAGGPNGFLARSLNLPAAQFLDYPPTQALYTHFANVRRCDRMPDFQTRETPPYAPDDAALHHVFEGGWMWVLRFNNGVTSAGAALEDWLARELNLAEGEAAWLRLLRRFPTIEAQFADAQALRPFVYAPRLSYRLDVAVGKGWALLPSAAAFVDPLFSTGMPLTLLGIERLGKIFAEAWGTCQWEARLQEYSHITLREAGWTAQFIAACYASMKNFPLFQAFSMFYFAAASHAEMARRVDMADRPQRFLAADYPPFASGMERAAKQLREHAQKQRNVNAAEFEQQVCDAIACLNVAGLCQPNKRHWYGVDMQDVITNAVKLGLTSAQMQAIVKTAAWAVS